MHKELNHIMLIDDDADDNFFHRKAIEKNNPAHIVIVKNSGQEAIEYLASGKEPHPDLIFLDINMPGMNGWEFLEKYTKLHKELQNQAIIILLTTSDNPNDVNKAKTWNCISDYLIKPLTKERMKNITEKYFN